MAGSTALPAVFLWRTKVPNPGVTGCNSYGNDTFHTP